MDGGSNSGKTPGAKLSFIALRCCSKNAMTVFFLFVLNLTLRTRASRIQCRWAEEQNANYRNNKKLKNKRSLPSTRSSTATLKQVFVFFVRLQMRLILKQDAFAHCQKTKIAIALTCRYLTLQKPTTSRSKLLKTIHHNLRLQIQGMSKIKNSIW